MRNEKINMVMQYTHHQTKVDRGSYII